MISLFIPYVNRLDLLSKAVASAPRVNVEIVVIDNSTTHDVPNNWPIRLVRPPVPLTFAQTQNWMLRMAEDKGESFYLFMHSDAEAVADSVQRLAAMANAFTIQKRKWGVIWTAYDALAAFSTEAMNAIGGWDTFLEWYAGDNDAYRRLKLAGYETIDSNLPVKHEPSQTLKADPEIAFRVSLMYPWRQAYYAQKWGGPPDREQFLTAFNR